MIFKKVSSVEGELKNDRIWSSKPEGWELQKTLARTVMAMRSYWQLLGGRNVGSTVRIMTAAAEPRTISASWEMGPCVSFESMSWSAGSWDWSSSCIARRLVQHLQSACSSPERNTDIHYRPWEWRVSSCSSGAVLYFNDVFGVWVDPYETSSWHQSQPYQVKMIKIRNYDRHDEGLSV